MKRILALVLAVLMMATVFVGCGNKPATPAANGGNNANAGDKNTNEFVKLEITDEQAAEGKANYKPEANAELLVWAPDKAVALIEEQCKAFAAQYPDANIKITVKAQGEGDASAALLNDPEKAADVFGFACDQLSGLINAKVIKPVNAFFVNDVVKNNSAGSIQAAAYDQKLYAFPETGDNGYYLVYDKSVVSDEDAKTLEGILAACKKAGKQFIFNVGNGFYGCTLPFTGGLEINGLAEDNVTQLFNDYNEDEVVDTLVAFATLFHEYEGTLVDNDPSAVTAGFSVDPKTVAAGVDGSWNAAGVAAALGENFGAAKLPTINVNGKAKQLISLHGYKLIGVNNYTKYPNAATLLADYLTNEACQIERAEKLSWGPSNINAAKSEAVTGNVAVSAILEQAANSLPQINIAGTFWTPMGTLGATLCKPGEKYDADTVRQLLKDTVSGIKDE